MTTETKTDERPFDDSENYSSNESGNRPFADVLEKASSRRAVMKGSLMGAAAGFLTPGAMAQVPGAPPSRRPIVGFDPVTIEEAQGDQTLPTISRDYIYQPFIPWGTPITPGATTEFDGDPNNRPNSEEAALQIGIGHDGIHYFPSRQVIGRTRPGGGFFRFQESGMLCVNHEFGINPHVLGKAMPESLEDVRISQHVHGVSVVAIEDRGREWRVTDSPNARRIHVNTPMAFSGPAAGSPLLENAAGNPALGTVNNCGSGPTPWGTYLTCEENFNGYFGWLDPSYTRTESQVRYGFSSGGFGYGWLNFDERFDISNPAYANESNRFGWVVEIDPFDGSKTPVKRTALGRFKHEAIAIRELEDGRIAAYMGDDQRFDYCYRFVSAKPWKQAIANGESPLDEGALYVAKFNEDQSGEWLELSMDVPALAAAFTGMDDLLVNTRLAADIVGATPMDRPEWTTVATDGSVFWTLTNNSRRVEPNVANPEAPNQDGHIIRTIDPDDGGTAFSWEIFILCSSTRDTPHVFTDPDAAYADPFGRLFIGTDGGQPDGLQDQVVVFDVTQPNPTPKRLLVGVVSDELTGWAYTPDYRVAFVNVQHPGDGNPGATSFPLPFNNFSVPRDATLIIRKKSGGIVGS